MRIRSSIGPQVLEDISQDFLQLLQTSAAIYEQNGDYALGICASGWCKLLDSASRALCDTDDDGEAARSGRWLCHESCWTDASRVCVETGREVDIECNGGLRIFALPIWCNGKVVGSMNFGYGTPPRDDASIHAIAQKYRVDPGDLRRAAESYEPRPRFVTEFAKHRLKTSARLISSMLERNLVEGELRYRTDELEIKLKEIHCLYSLSQLVGRPGIELAEILAGVADLLPSSMRFPQSARVRILYENEVFRCSDFREGDHSYASPLRVGDRQVGTIEVHYPDIAVSDREAQKAFETGELELVGLVAERLGRVIERYSLLAEIEEHRRQQEKELDRIGSLGGEYHTPIASSLYGLAPISRSSPARFEEIVSEFEAFLEQALEERAFKVDRSVSRALRSLAEELVFLRAGPRDVVDILTTAVRRKSEGAPEAKARVLMDEGRFMAFELMGLLVSLYRHGLLLHCPSVTAEGEYE